MSTIRERKWVYLGTTVLVAVASVGAASLLHGTGNGAVDAVSATVSTAAAAVAPPPPPSVDVAPVVAETITEFQSYSGRLQAINQVAIRPLVSGTIVSVHFQDGAMVKKGEPLFTIDPRPYQAAVDRAAAQLAAAQAGSGYATSDAERAQRLLTDNAIAKRDYDQKQNAAREGVANVKAAQAALESAQVDLSYTHIVSPIDGRASRAELTVGNVVSTGANAPLLTTVVSVSPIYAAFDVDEQTYLNDLAKDKASTATVPVNLGLANETGYSRQGHIDSVDNSLDTRSGTIRVRARFDNTDGALVPGLYARVEVGGGRPHPAVMITDAAVGTDQDKKYVLVVDKDNKAQYREVTLGSEHDGLRIITQGLAPGERIVVNGLQRVRPSNPVTPHDVGMTGVAASNAS